MSSIANTYQHWTGQSTGIWTRRAVITRYGIRLCWKSRILKMVFASVWVIALLLAAFYFFVGQLLTPDSAVAQFVTESFGRQARAVLNGFTAWILLYPEVSIDGLYRAPFYFITELYTTLSFFAVSLFVPKLISHDLSSKAILIYNSKALSPLDYLVGKFGIVSTILSMLLVAPLVAVWFVGNLLSPDWSFFVHSLPALWRALVVGGVSVVALSFLALAISSLAKRTSAAAALWFVLWIVSSVVGQAVSQVFPWGRYLSPRNCLHEIAKSLYDLDSVLAKAQTMLPFFNSALGPLSAKSARLLTPTGDPVWLPFVFLTAFSALAILALSKRTQTE